MGFSLKQRGTKEVIRRLERIQQAGPHMMRRVATEANRRHASAFKRRSIPEDTGRLKASLTSMTHKDRVVSITKERIKIASTVPYAQYQAARIRKLSVIEMKEIFIVPIHEAFDQVTRGVS